MSPAAAAELHKNNHVLQRGFDIVRKLLGGLESEKCSMCVQLESQSNKTGEKTAAVVQWTLTTDTGGTRHANVPFSH